MKKQFKYIALGLGAIMVSSCADLDTAPLGSALTVQQKQDAITARPQLGVAGVTSISSSYSSFGSIYGSDTHFDFGYPAIMIGLDSQTADYNGGNSGYNWFANWQGFTSPTNSGIPTNMAWYQLYTTIKIENDVLATLNHESTEPLEQFYLAQAFANRAFNYWVLANLYQFNYQLNPEALCVPILTEKNVEEVAMNGCARATVAQVFDQIISDLNTAVTYLETSKVDPASTISNKPKRMVSLATAYGLRARAYLTMGKYAEAAADAQKAIDSFSGRPYSFDEVSKPAFNSIEDPSWMWGIAIAETDNVVRTGLCNFPSMSCSLADGYTSQGGTWRWISEDLYQSIPLTDVRKGWFLDSECKSVNLSEAQQAYLDTFAGAYSYGYASATFLFPYTNVKFDAYQGVIGQTTNASDVPLMRIEEMYYILAEGQAMSGNPQLGLETLREFVLTYRNPKYDYFGTDPNDIQEKIFQQRRVEFWGEGLVWFDYMRLNKGVDRRAAKAPYAYTYNILPGSPQLIYCIPLSEITANPLINEEDNNPSSSQPTPA